MPAASDVRAILLRNTARATSPPLGIATLTAYPIIVAAMASRLRRPGAEGESMSFQRQPRRTTEARTIEIATSIGAMPTSFRRPMRSPSGIRRKASHKKKAVIARPKPACQENQDVFSAPPFGAFADLDFNGRAQS